MSFPAFCEKLVQVTSSRTVAPNKKNSPYSGSRKGFFENSFGHGGVSVSRRQASLSLFHEGACFLIRGTILWMSQKLLESPVNNLSCIFIATAKDIKVNVKDNREYVAYEAITSQLL